MNLSIDQHRDRDVKNNAQHASPKGRNAIFASVGNLAKLLEKGQKFLTDELKNVQEIGKTSANAILHSRRKPGNAINEGLMLQGLIVTTEVSKSAVKEYKSLLVAEKAAATSGKHSKTENNPKTPKA